MQNLPPISPLLTPGLFVPLTACAWKLFEELPIFPLHSSEHDTVGWQ